jgi:hypothetical protein
MAREKVKDSGEGKKKIGRRGRESAIKRREKVWLERKKKFGRRERKKHTP